MPKHERGRLFSTVGRFFRLSVSRFRKKRFVRFLTKPASPSGDALDALTLQCLPVFGYACSLPQDD